jgi:hypothetical protein
MHFGEVGGLAADLFRFAFGIENSLNDETGAHGFAVFDNWTNFWRAGSTQRREMKPRRLAAMESK